MKGTLSSASAGKPSLLRRLFNLRLRLVDAGEVHEQEQMEAVVHEKARLLLKLQSVSKTGSYVLDIASGVWESSSVLDNIFGISANDQRSLQSWLSIVHPDDRQFMAEYLSRDVIEHRPPFDETYRIVRIDDGVERWVHGLGNFEYDSKGRPSSLFGTIQDVTVAKQAEMALQASEQQSRAMLELLPVAVWKADAQGLSEYVNQTWCDLSGLTFEQALGNGWQQALHEDDRARVSNSWIEGSPRPERWTDEYRVVTPDGNIRWVLGEGAAIRDADDQLGGYLGANVDITAQKHTELALRRQELIVANSSDMLALLNTEYVYLDANPAYLRPFGLAYDRVVGRSVPDVLGKKFFNETIKPNADQCMKGVEVHYQEWFDFPISGRAYMDIQYHPYFDDAGSVQGFVVNARNITNQKRAEEAIRALTLDLERRVRERTEGLETANRKLENFSYAVSHDLKAPLRAIDAYSGMLEEELTENLSPEAKRMLEIVRQKSHHMSRLIDELLAFAGLGRTELKFQDVDMSEMAESVFGEIVARQPDREINLLLHNLPAIHADYALMQQVWTNLLDNAIKFTGNRKVTEIEIGSREETNNCVFFVKDNGAGFESAYRDKLFGVFQRLHHEDEFPGTGVGLANVQQIVERHGGEAWAEGETDLGATFFFRVPRVGVLT